MRPFVANEISSVRQQSRNASEELVAYTLILALGDSPLQISSALESPWRPGTPAGGGEQTFGDVYSDAHCIAMTGRSRREERRRPRAM